MMRKISLVSFLFVALHLGAFTVATVAQDLSVVGRWSSVPDLPLVAVHVHMLPTGKVMMWGGADRSTGDDPRLWDPLTETTSLMALPGYDIFCAGHSFLAEGGLLVVGGHIRTGVGLPKASVYNPFTNVWAPLPNMNAGRWYPTSTTLANGDALVTSGAIDKVVGVNLLPQVFEAASGTWRNLTDAQRRLIPYPRMHLTPNGRVFYSAPARITRYLDTSGTGAWTVVAKRKFGSRTHGASVQYDDWKVLVTGGAAPSTNTAEVIDLNAPSPAWRFVGPMAYARRNLNATLLPDGTVLVTGGADASNAPVYAAEMWDPVTEKWTTMASQLIPRLYHSTALLLPDGRVLTTGGNRYTQAEVYEPPYLFKGARPTITSAPTSVPYGGTFFVETLDAASITQVTWIRLSSVTHSVNMSQRINRLSFSEAPGGLNLVAPSNPNLAPVGHYMLFILNSSGASSVAKIVQIQ